MELRQLRYFVRIVELGSLSRAAADLYIAQPALSQQLASLESELKLRLLVRRPRGVSPTPAGETFYCHAQAVLRQLDRLQSAVRNAGDEPSGTVSIGMPPSVAGLLAQPLAWAARERFPRLRLQIREGLSGLLEELVAKGRIEMCLLFDRSETFAGGVARRTTMSYLNVHPLLTEELMLLTAGSEFAGDPINLKEAATLQYILFPGPGNATRQLIQETWDKAGYALNIIAELDSISTIKLLVARGMGATILSSSALSSGHTEGLTSRRIDGVNLTRRVCLCTSNVAPIGDAAERVIGLINEIAQSLVREGAWHGATLITQEPLDSGPSDGTFEGAQI
jgi:DNA-binding transcriptional LysR family regulator